jgi:hypothetical protein
MSIGIDDLFTPQTPAQWLQNLLTAAGVVGLSTSSWQPGGITRTIFAILSNSLSAEDQIVSVMAKGGFLDTAASVTPDPATLGAAAKPGWLDLLADSVYNVQRVGATFASGTVTFTNASASSYGPFAAGTFHLANPGTGALYSNSASFTIAPSTTTSAKFIADVAGSTGTSAPGTITTVVTALIGVTVTNAASFVGSDPETNADLVSRCRAKLAALSPNGPSDAYRYFALTSDEILQALTPPQSLTTPVTKAKVAATAGTGVVTTTVANAGGAVAGASNLLISGATNATPIVITVPSTTGITTGDTVFISGVTGNTAANGYHVCTVVSGTTLSLNSSVGNAAYAGGGVLEGGDLGLVDEIIQANAVPLSVAAVTVSATNHNVAVAASVWVPAAQTAVVGPLIQTALTSYFAALPIGGLTDPGGAYIGVVPFNAVLGVIEGAASYIQQATLTLNTGTSNISLAGSEVAVLSPTPVIAVHGI